MIQGFTKALLATAITVLGVGPAFAAAPVIGSIPNVIIGDNEDFGPSDNNFFRFTNAFRFDDYVTDADTDVEDLLWSFDEGLPAQQWYTINAKDPIQVGTTSDAPHITPAGTFELRQAVNSGDEYANFRDIIFSPPPDALPYPDPVDDHSNGKSVYLYASDGTNVASREIIVSTVDNAFDQLTGGSPFTCWDTDDFTIGSFTFNAASDSDVTVGWNLLALPIGGVTEVSYDSVESSLKVRVFASASGRLIGWRTTTPAGTQTPNPEILPYANVGPSNYVYGKFSVYAVKTSPAAANNTIPNLRLRLANFFAITAKLIVNNHADDAADRQPFYQELRPSLVPASPSVYKVHFDPIDVPYLNDNGTTSGIARGFEAYELTALGNGTLALAESSICTYPATELADSVSSPPLIKQFNTAADFGSGTGESRITVDQSTFGNANLNDPLIQITYTAVPASVTLSTANVPTNRVGVATKDFLYPAGNGGLRPRIEADKVYTAKFDITSTLPNAQQARMRLRVRTVRFAYTMKYEVGPAVPTGLIDNQLLAQQSLPGPSTQNAEAPFYRLILQSPLDVDLRPDSIATGALFAPSDPVSVRFPNLTGIPGPGVTSGTDDTRTERDISVGVDTVDGINFNPFASAITEVGNIRVNGIEIRAFDALQE